MRGLGRTAPPAPCESSHSIASNETFANLASTATGGVKCRVCAFGTHTRRIPRASRGFKASVGILENHARLRRDRELLRG